MADDVGECSAESAPSSTESTTGAGKPGGKRRRRWLQFSIRSLLVAMGLAALLMGLLGVPLFRLRRQIAVSERLQEAGARLSWEAADGTVMDRLAEKLFGDKAAVHVTEVVWDRVELSPSDLADLEWLDHAQVIDLGWSSVNDDGMVPMRALRHLRYLNIDGATITDRGLGYLSGCRSLERLKAHGAHVTDAGLVHLANLAELENLDLSSTRITGEHLEPLLQLPALKVLNLNETQLGDASVPVLSRLNQLLWLGVSHTHLSDTARDALAAALPKTAIDD
ncbi:MAG TPA: hypothetical protein VHC22_07825 [Pirellulales bacterium]|nr:hypothetical protein [Pirellulales bacterium]